MTMDNGVKDIGIKNLTKHACHAQERSFSCVFSSIFLACGIKYISNSLISPLSTMFATGNKMYQVKCLFRGL